MKYPELTEMENKVIAAIKVDEIYSQSDSGSCWTCVEQIAEDSGLAVNQVKGVLGSLQKKRVLFIDEDNGAGDEGSITVAEQYR